MTCLSLFQSKPLENKAHILLEFTYLTSGEMIKLESSHLNKLSPTKGVLHDFAVSERFR